MSENATVMNPAETYALVIGINDYAHGKTQKLVAACPDADRFKDFLTKTLRVPDEHIINLRDGQATRKGILDGFEHLEHISKGYYEQTGSKAGNTTGRTEDATGGKAGDAAGDKARDKAGAAAGGGAKATAGGKAGDKPPEPRLGPCMIIFFAGHGARNEKPKGWGDWAPDSKYVEMLCPSDIGMPLSVLEKEDPVDGGGKGKPFGGDEDGEPVDGGGNGRSVGEDGDGEGVDSLKVEGIPDRTICWLLNRLSEKRGNNITLILDCCHSAGINRGGGVEPGSISRRMLYPPPVSGKADPLVDWSLTDEERLDEESPGRAIHQLPGFGGKFHDSHVLLSACGKEQAAREKDGSGIFTNALMKVLEGEFGKPKKPKLLAPLTYSTLMAHLNMPEFQTPHCEGSNINKVLFTRQRAVSDSLFIPCRKTQVEIDKKGQKMKQEGQKPKQWILTLDAGSAQGIAQGELFSYHENDNPVGPAKSGEKIPILVATEVKTATSILNHWPDPKKGFQKGKHFYAKRIDWSKDPPKIFCEDPAFLDTLFPSNDQTKRIVRVANKEDALLSLELKDNRVRLLRTNQAFLENCQVPSFTVGVRKENAIRAAVGGLQHFNSHLHREGAEFPGVRMELHFLEPVAKGDGRDLTDEEAQRPENFSLVGNNLLVEEPTTLKLPDPETEEKPLGVTLYNDGDAPVYPYLFYFDPNDLTIVPWYLVPTGAGLGKVDPPLKARSKFCIGYGNGAAAPWSFHFIGGRTKDIGYFKLFLSTSPINFESLIREASPFDEWDKGASRCGRLDATARVLLENFTWGAKVFTVIQELESEGSK